MEAMRHQSTAWAHPRRATSYQRNSDSIAEVHPDAQQAVNCFFEHTFRFIIISMPMQEASATFFMLYLCSHRKQDLDWIEAFSSLRVPNTAMLLPFTPSKRNEYGPSHHRTTAAMCRSIKKPVTSLHHHHVMCSETQHGNFTMHFW